MRARLRLVGGTLMVNSEPGRGIEIVAAVPVRAFEKEDQVRIKMVGLGS
jgi:signal transduction histidine kinase